MNWSEKIKSIESHGLTQQQIAARVLASQSLISDLRTGRRGKRISYGIATRLLALADELDAAKKSAA